MTRAATALLVAILLARCASTRPADREVTALVDRMLVERNIPAAAVVAMRGDRVIHASGHGGATPETLFQLGSISKQFTAAAILRLAARGTIRLDAPASTYLPEMPWADVRIEHLLHHTSGIREFFTIAEFHEEASDLNRPAEELVAMIVRTPLGFEPGSRWSYSNSNYTLLAAIIERVTGQPYDQYLRKEFFEPLGLDSIRHCPTVPTKGQYAAGFALRSGKLAPSESENLNWARGDGGLCGNALDLAKWTAELELPRPVSAAPRYAAGLAYVPLDERVDRIGHNGAMSGFSASAARYPQHDLAVVVLTNLGGVWADAIEKAVTREILGLSSSRLQEVPLDDAAAFAGRFDIGVHDFPAAVERRADGLWLVMKRPGPTTRLRHVGDREFVSEDEPDGVRVRFDETRERLVLYMGGMEWYGVRVR